MYQTAVMYIEWSIQKKCIRYLFLCSDKREMMDFRAGPEKTSTRHCKRNIFNITLEDIGSVNRAL